MSNAPANLQRINARLEELIPDRPQPLYQAARYALLSPGKRFRPRLVLASAATFCSDPLIALDPACAIEMIHAYSLIHDDLPCMDDDDLRRGRPSLHKAFSEPLALLTGDYLLSYAFEVLSKAPYLSSEKKLQLIQILSHAAGSEGMVGGQAIDIEASGTILDEDALLSMHFGKTAALFIACLQFGAVIGEASKEMFSLLQELGKEIGLAYQFHDDLLDATSSPSILGKNVRRDAVQGKNTAVSYYGVEETEKKLQELNLSITSKLSRLPGGSPHIQPLVHKFFRQLF